MANPVWATASGSLGNQPKSVPLNINLIAYPIAPATSVTFSLINGVLPNGLTLSSQGLIYGTPTGFNGTGYTFRFTIRATDNLGNYTNKTFTMTIIGQSVPIWQTPEGSLGTYATQFAVSIQLVATPQQPAVNVLYSLLSGTLPAGLSLSQNGIISGIPTDTVTSNNQTFSFVVRATDNKQQCSDRTFSIIISGNISPQLLPATPYTFSDGTWIEIPILYTNPISTNKVDLTVAGGILPAGLEISPNGDGLIRGYAAPPTSEVILQEINAVATSTSDTTNAITVTSIDGFVEGRPVQFTGTTIGGLSNTQTYYVKTVSLLSFTVSLTQNGDVVPLNSQIGFMNIILPSTTTSTPIVRTYTFNIKLTSELGNDIQSYSITIINQNAPVSEGGQGLLAKRIPAIYNTKPETFVYSDYPTEYGYFVVPPEGTELPNGTVGSINVPLGSTYPVTEYAFIGNVLKDNIFDFRIIGHDFDGDALQYISFNSQLPNGLSLDINTGWITGVPTMTPGKIIEQKTFAIQVRKADNPSIFSEWINFAFTISDTIDPTITWITPVDLGTIYNASKSTLKIEASSKVPLIYVKDSGNLPPNLTLLENGEIIGTVAFQPEDTFKDPLATSTFTFTVKSYNVDNPLVASYRTFTLNVLQEFNPPTDNLYIKCTPGFEDRAIIDDLLTNTNIIPNDFLYRSDDSNFGKAQSVVYAHAYGINASQLPEYIEAIKAKNHYWRNITLGEIKTAIARDDDGNILYEVVYSEVVDNLINPQGISIQKEITWPRLIDLGLGPWYTSSTEIYTSYEFLTEQFLLSTWLSEYLLTQNQIKIMLTQGAPAFYTSLTPGYARLLYPNSLPNMRKQVSDVLGANYDYKLLPKWMTSQQINGSTLGFTPAWVICYTKPRSSYTTVATATFKDTNRIVVDSTEGFMVDKPVIFTGNTFGNIRNGDTYYVKSIESETEITISQTAGGQTYSLYDGIGRMTATFLEISYSDIIKANIQNEWPYKLNQINFKLDRFTVDKSLTYNYNNDTVPATWSDLPSATPPPDPIDSKDFYVLFPRRTILPTDPQYY